MIYAMNSFLYAMDSFMNILEDNMQHETIKFIFFTFTNCNSLMHLIFSKNIFVSSIYITKSVCLRTKNHTYSLGATKSGHRLHFGEYEIVISLGGVKYCLPSLFVLEDYSDNLQG